MIILLELYINGTLTETDWNNSTVYGDVTTFNDSGAYVLTFDNDVVVKISASFEFKLMTFTLTLPSELQGNVTGLLGKFRNVHF